MLIYLASPYTPTKEQIDAARVSRLGFPAPSRDEASAAVKEARFDAAVAATAELMNAGAHVISPIASSHPVAVAHKLPGGYAYWQALDRELIDACGEVWVLCLDGWEESVGIADEVAHAHAHGKVVRYVDPTDVTAPLRDATAPALAPYLSPSFVCGKRNCEDHECPDCEAGIYNDTDTPRCVRCFYDHVCQFAPRRKVTP